MASRGYGFSGAPRHPGAGGGGWEPRARMRAIRSQLRARGRASRLGFCGPGAAVLVRPPADELPNAREAWSASRRGCNGEGLRPDCAEHQQEGFDALRRGRRLVRDAVIRVAKTCRMRTGGPGVELRDSLPGAGFGAILEADAGTRNGPVVRDAARRPSSSRRSWGMDESGNGLRGSMQSGPARGYGSMRRAAP
jgi:hypothetical protein